MVTPFHSDVKSNWCELEIKVINQREVTFKCGKCGFVNPDIRAWDGTSANPNKL